MMIMPSNNRKGICHYLACKYPDKIGLLFSPNGWSTPPWYFNYALDNGCFTGWNEKKYYMMLSRASLCHKPMWAIVPDVVADAEGTFRMWHEHHKKVASFGFPLAFACQDGMEPRDVPKEAYCAFIGGSTEWKLENAGLFKGSAPWLHIGRVNTPDRLKWAKACGADSVDGTVFFRGANYQTRAFLEHFFERQQCINF